jgi:2-alkyl-3-oxoalkanoate reductase
MKILLAGATGAVGRALVPMLVRAGHEVFGTTRSKRKAAAISAMGARPIIMNGLDRNEVLKAVQTAEPEAIVHQMTSLTASLDLKNFDKEFELTNQLRTRGTEYLIAAAEVSGARRIVVQSFTGWPNARTGSPIKTESDPLDATPPRSMRQTLDAIREVERRVLAVTGIEGIVLRYGAFYGPGCPIAEDGPIVEMIRRRRLPIVGSGAGVWSFVHIADVATATARALEGAPTGLYNIVDNEPAPVSVWLPEAARVLGARSPMHVPAWIARLLIGDSGVSMMTSIRGSSNAKAKQMLGWEPAYGTWRDGFREVLRNQGA